VLLLCTGGCSPPLQQQSAGTSEFLAQYANDPVYKALTAAKAPPPPLIEGESLTAVLVNGRKVGELKLCSTTVEQAQALFPKPPMPTFEGDPRSPRGFPPVAVGAVHPQPRVVFNPWQTNYSLYFDSNNLLVIVQILLSSGFATLPDFKQRYPQLKEITRNAEAVEMQGEIGRCVAAMTLSTPNDERVDQLAYACTCETK
jgi:hypothetical protein